MNISVPSRFACLKIEDDEGQSSRKSNESARKRAPDAAPPKRSGNGKKPAQSKQVSNPRRAKKAQEQMQRQWEEWKEKDDKFVNGNYEQDLESALLLSKIHYEENKDKYAPGNPLGKRHEKKKKTKTMSLDQFLSKDSAPAETDSKEVLENENFFEQLHSETKKLCKKDEVSQLRKDRENAIEELITSSQYHEKLEVERKRNRELEKELAKAREEIANVKVRNQTLCTMLSTGEMKDKADVLLELERLNIIKNDLTDEVARLHGLLEQERSKVAPAHTSNSDSKHKEKKPTKKSTR